MKTVPLTHFPWKCWTIYIFPFYGFSKCFSQWALGPFQINISTVKNVLALSFHAIVNRRGKSTSKPLCWPVKHVQAGPHTEQPLMHQDFKKWFLRTLRSFNITFDNLSNRTSWYVFDLLLCYLEHTSAAFCCFAEVPKPASFSFPWVVFYNEAGFITYLIGSCTQSNLESF